MNIVLDLSYVLNTTWEAFKKQWVKLSIMVLALCVVVYCISLFNPLQPPVTNDSMELLSWYGNNFFGICLGYAIPGLVQTIFVAYIYKEILCAFKGVQINLTVDVLLRFVVVTFITGLLSYISIMMCVIPAFFVIPRLIVASLYILDRPQMSIGQAIETSWKDTKGHVIYLILLGFVALGISLLGVLACFVGVIPASAFLYVMLVVIYLVLTGQIGFFKATISQDVEEAVVE
ncbi:MAG: hypothetical protein J6R79_02155 [Bacteroidaceae bacterium]|nr:hypothetical protein [Bacteroidaceae bacterium]